MSESLMLRDRAVARKKGIWALSAWVGTAVLFHYTIVGSLLVGGGALYLTYKWFMFRAKRGMRF